MRMVGGHVRDNDRRVNPLTMNVNVSIFSKLDVELYS